ncbi:hypothetical protein GCM10022252_54700 [Streptosporangium oxazolinicum]|uniref:Uncharacterized protein n=1 Tax=Streptosporangium oxazolinicum TaxID=909287 RepID=A0ABP8B951_9ACTN
MRGLPVLDAQGRELTERLVDTLYCRGVRAAALNNQRHDQRKHRDGQGQRLCDVTDDFG